jgi:vitamin B12 transporter
MSLVSKSFRPALAAAIVAGLSASSPAHAADAPRDASAGAAADDLVPVVVTANRHAVPADAVLASVTVLDRAAIEASQAPDLLDLLGRQAGVDIARTGGAGQASTVFLRGGNSAHALVLVDGVRVNAATSGVLDFAHLPLAQIERIEIVRGPRAALWGSDAIGGVIQVFTRDPAASFFEAHGGSYQRGGASAGVGLARGDARLGLAVGADAVDGYSATTPAAFGHDPDRDGYVNRNLSLRGRTAVGTQVLSASALVTDADVEFDQGETSAINRVGGIQLAGPLSGARWSHVLSLGHSSEDLVTPAYGSEFGSARESLDWVHAIALDARNDLNVGLNWSREQGYSLEFGEGFDEARRNAALFASWRGRAGAHLFEASARHDDNSQFGGASTGNAGWGWQFAPAWRLRASWGQGFRAPNFSELYYPGFFGLFAGNPALQPERSTSSELGLHWEREGHRAALSAYRTRVRDLIAFQGVDFQAVNVARAAVDGVEFDGGARFGAFSLSANATWQRARDLDSGQALLRRARRKANLAADWHFDNGAGLGLDLVAVSARPDFSGPLHGYGRVDLRASAPLAANWRLDFRLENLGDREYALVDGYATAGRSGLLSLHWAGN